MPPRVEKTVFLMDKQELELVRVALLTNGAVYELVSGEVKAQKFVLDGKFVANAHVSNCALS